MFAMLAACHSAPPKQAAAKPAPVAPAPAVTPASGKNTAPLTAANAPAAAPGAAAPTAPEAPIPPRAAQQYAQALQMMKAGRGTDAELEFKQLAVAYPQFAGPQLNLGLLYLKDSRLADAETAFKAAVPREVPWKFAVLLPARVRLLAGRRARLTLVPSRRRACSYDADDRC